MVPWNQRILMVILVLAICCGVRASDDIFAANPNSNDSEPIFSSQPPMDIDASRVHPIAVSSNLSRRLSGDKPLTSRDFNFESQYANASSQIDPVQVFKLALDEFPFLSELNIHLHRLEKWCDRQAKKIGLNGSINLLKKTSLSFNCTIF